VLAERSRRDVLIVSEDPGYSRRANDVMAEELREAAGAQEVVLEPAAPGERGRRRVPPLVAAAWGSRMLIVITFLAMIVIAAIVGVATESWWALVAASVIHGIATIVVLVVVVRVTHQVEHPDPGRAAVLEGEGVLDPERELDERLRSMEQARDARARRPRDDAA